MNFWPLLCLLLVGCAPRTRPPLTPSQNPPLPIGAGECSRCHQAEAGEWQKSHHAGSMQRANARTVLGDFSGVVLGDSRFFQRDGAYYIRTAGPDGKVQDYPVSYTFGLYPLQQYLLPLPGGRLQVFQWAWDARPRKDGGQRWFKPDPGSAGGVLNWTGPYQNWNFMCADCHSTGVHKNYDSSRASYATQSLETSVSCEACHGPGSHHRTWAEGGAQGIDHGWSRPAAPWIETCARCHSRRSALTQSPEGLDFHDAYEPETLEAPNYQVDGQVLEEDFELGAFRQSKMHAQGVTCLDCHQAHSLKLRHEGNQLCLRCHDSNRFSAQNHSHHLPEGPGSECVSCHMPGHTYMGVHRRHDHSLRVPRPDLSVTLGTDNACTSCHSNRSARWASQAVQAWFGPHRRGFQNHAPAFQAARRQKAGAEDLLLSLAGSPQTPAIVRATALAELRRYLSERSLPGLEAGLADPDPGVRIQALKALQGLDLEQRWERAQGLLKDPRLAVRLRAVRLLGAFPPDRLGPEREQRLAPALEEFWRWGQDLADRPEAHLEVGELRLQRGQYSQAESSYRQALELEPRLAHAYINLADLYRLQAQDQKAESTLRQGLACCPREAGLHHALGLTLVRRGQSLEAVRELEQAAQLEPADLDYAYVLMVAWAESGRAPQALKLAGHFLESYPEQEQLLTLARQLAARCGQAGLVSQYSKRLQQLTRRRP